MHAYVEGWGSAQCTLLSVSGCLVLLQADGKSALQECTAFLSATGAPSPGTGVSGPTAAHSPGSVHKPPKMPASRGQWACQSHLSSQHHAVLCCQR